MKASKSPDQESIDLHVIDTAWGGTEPFPSRQLDPPIAQPASRTSTESQHF